MGATVKQILDAVAPEFKSVKDTDPAFIVFLELAGHYVAESAWGDSTNHAKALLIAHYMKFGQLGGRGAVSSEKVGDLARSYASMGDTELHQTQYGTQYYSLRKTIYLGPIVV